MPAPTSAAPADPELDQLVRDIIGRVADKWTMIVLERLAEHGRLRFTRLGELVEGVSQKMLTKTLRQMEADGLVLRTVHPVVPPRVDYRAGHDTGRGLLRRVALGRAAPGGDHGVAPGVSGARGR
jgi:DNA-binding HxlR family transcriptional regulator